MVFAVLNGANFALKGKRELKQPTVLSRNKINKYDYNSFAPNGMEIETIPIFY
jgi:hypothetical protein